MLRCVALDDYQNVARQFGDWDRLRGRVELSSVTEYISGRDAVAARLKGVDIVIAMRERTPFDRALLDRLPDLKLLITTGLKNAAIDVKAAAERSIPVCGTESSAVATAELTWGLIFGLLRHIPDEAQNFKSGG